MKKLLFNSIISSVIFFSCNSSTQPKDNLDSTVLSIDTLQSAAVDSTSISDTILTMKEEEMKEEEKEISSGEKKEIKEMPEHHAPNQNKVDSIKNSYPKKK